MMLSSRRTILESPPSPYVAAMDHCSSNSFPALGHRPAFHVPGVDGPLLGSSRHEEFNP